MLRSAANDFSEYVKVDMAKQVDSGFNIIGWGTEHPCYNPDLSPCDLGPSKRGICWEKCISREGENKIIYPEEGISVHRNVGFTRINPVRMKFRLAPIETSIDDMLTRLEEFESMVLLVQQERGNVVGLTGTLTQVFDKKGEIDILCDKIDVLESLVLNVRETLDSLEEQVDTIEEQNGYYDNSSLRNFFMPKMFKKASENKTSTSRVPILEFKTDNFFVPSDNGSSEEK